MEISLFFLEAEIVISLSVSTWCVFCSYSCFILLTYQVWVFFHAYQRALWIPKSQKNFSKKPFISIRRIYLNFLPICKVIHSVCSKVRCLYRPQHAAAWTFYPLLQDNLSLGTCPIIFHIVGFPGGMWPWCVANTLRFIQYLCLMRQTASLSQSPNICSSSHSCKTCFKLIVYLSKWSFMLHI